MQPTTYREGGKMLHKIKKLAKERHIKMCDLEKIAGVSPKGIYRWDIQEPSVRKVYRVAKALGTTVEYLVENEV